MSFSSFLAHVCATERRAIDPGVMAGNSGGICAMPESLGLHCPLVPEWNLRKAHCDTQGVGLGLRGRIGRVGPRVVFLKSHQARQLPSEALCCLEQKTQALSHYLVPFTYSLFTRLTAAAASTPKCSELRGRWQIWASSRGSDPLMEKLPCWNTFPPSFLSLQGGDNLEDRSPCATGLWCFPG